jgi:hypothetical protein
MLENGKYSVWFRTPLGEGTGIAVCEDGKITGRDTVIAYSGTYTLSGDDFSADVAIKRHSPGQLSVFGIDDVDIEITGRCIGVTASCQGKSKQPPGMAFEATMIRIAE